MNKQAHNCTILSKTELAPNTYDMLVEFPLSTEPGQFIHIDCGDQVLLRRPISICDSGENWLRFIFAVRGKGTALLAQKQEGDTVNLLGPLGNGFDASKRGDGTAIVIGGGIGIYPLVKLAKRLGSNVESILGFRTKELITLQGDFESICTQTHIATDDGSYGFHGLVTDVLQERIKQTNVTAIYACGPIPMMRAIKKIAVEHNIFCELSMEERMGCGIGACAVCVCKSKGGYAKVCQNGPVFNALDLEEL